MEGGLLKYLSYNYLLLHYLLNSHSSSDQVVYVQFVFNIFDTFRVFVSTKGRLRGGGTLSKCQGPRAFGGPRRFLVPRGCLWRHVFRDRTARFWADILYMYRGAGAPRFNIKYESRTFLCN